jgi:hypothetical protein
VPLHLQTKKNTEAESTEQLEIEDNLYFVVTKFREQAGEEPTLIMDNILIQAGVEDDWIDCRYGVLGLAAGCRIRITTHSPDFNQVAEHIIALGKRETRNEMYRLCCRTGVMRGRTLQWAVTQVFNKIKRGDVYKGSVAANVQRMPLVWRVIGSSQDTVVTDAHTGKKYKGVAGDWAPAGLN